MKGLKVCMVNDEVSDPMMGEKYRMTATKRKRSARNATPNPNKPVFVKEWAERQDRRSQKKSQFREKKAS